MKKLMKERGFLGALHVTSTKTGEGCDQLREAIVQAIDLKSEILGARDSGVVLIGLAELKQRCEFSELLPARTEGAAKSHERAGDVSLSRATGQYLRHVGPATIVMRQAQDLQ
jgi:hypothetical protein